MHIGLSDETLKNGGKKIMSVKWWDKGCCTLAYIKDIKPECLTDEAKIKYKEELENGKSKK
jgi:hypothetical protein